jgi:hypothetical protein
VIGPLSGARAGSSFRGALADDRALPSSRGDVGESRIQGPRRRERGGEPDPDKARTASGMPPQLDILILASKLRLVPTLGEFATKSPDHEETVQLRIGNQKELAEEKPLIMEVRYPADRYAKQEEDQL